jgi:kynureninase
MPDGGAPTRTSQRSPGALLPLRGKGGFVLVVWFHTGRLIELAESRGLECATPRDPLRRGGTAAVDFENALEVARELNARDVVVDYRPGVGICMSPHFYTADEELDRAFEAIDEIRASGTWR